MTLSQSDVSDLLDAFRVGDGVDLIRESVRLVLQELIETELTETIGAGRFERTEDRTGERIGSRPRLLATKAGDVELAIPKLRKGSFFPSILEPRRRIDQALYAVVMEAYVAGVSARSVDDLVAALGIDSGISKSEVSRICGGLDEVTCPPHQPERVERLASEQCVALHGDVWDRNSHDSTMTAGCRNSARKASHRLRPGVGTASPGK